MVVSAHFLEVMGIFKLYSIIGRVWGMDFGDHPISDNFRVIDGVSQAIARNSHQIKGLSTPASFCCLPDFLIVGEKG
jgi:hypothetical protein